MNGLLSKIKYGDCGIYKITSPTGRVYIGQSVNIRKRLLSYRNLECNNQIKLIRSFYKHGFENHTIEVVLKCNPDELNKNERYYQEKYKSVRNGLNCVLTKTEDKSGVMSDDVKKKIGDAQRGSLNHNYGKKASKETREKLSKIHKGKKISPEHAEKLRLISLGRKASKETKLKQSKAKIGKPTWNKGIKWMSDDQKKHLSDLNKGKFSGSKHNMAKKVIDQKTGKIYGCAKEVANMIGVKEATFRSWISGRRPNKTSYKYL